MSPDFTTSGRVISFESKIAAASLSLPALSIQFLPRLIILFTRATYVSLFCESIVVKSKGTNTIIESQRTRVYGMQ